MNGIDHICNLLFKHECLSVPTESTMSDPCFDMLSPCKALCFWYSCRGVDDDSSTHGYKGRAPTSPACPDHG